MSEVPKPAHAGGFVSTDHRAVLEWTANSMDNCRASLETPQLSMQLTEYERGRLTAYKELVSYIEGLYERDNR